MVVEERRLTRHIFAAESGCPPYRNSTDTDGYGIMKHEITKHHEVAVVIMVIIIIIVPRSPPHRTAAEPPFRSRTFVRT